MAEARNLRNLTAAQTPLLGEENTPLHTSEGTGFGGITPRAAAAFTPNPLATPRSTTNGDTSAQPTPFRMPGLDALGINTPMTTSGAAFDQTPIRGGRGAEKAEKRALSAAFQSLPAPQNDFSIMLPEEADQDADEGAEKIQVEDAAERDKRLKREEEERKRVEFNRRSLPVQKGYPRPVNVNPTLLQRKLDQTGIDDGADAEFLQAQNLINEELARLATHDTIAFPLPGTMNTGSTKSHYLPPDDSAVADAKALIEREMAAALGFPGASSEKVKEGIAILAKDQETDEDSSADAFSSWAALRTSLVYDASQKTWTDTGSLDTDSVVAGLKTQWTSARETMAREAARSMKVEKKLGLVLGGYQTRSEGLRKKLEEGFASLVTLQSDLRSFEELKMVEGAAGPARLEGLHAEVGKLQRRDGVLQGRYKELLDERDRLVGSIAGLEDKLQDDMDEMNVDA